MISAHVETYAGINGQRRDCWPGDRRRCRSLSVDMDSLLLSSFLTARPRAVEPGGRHRTAAKTLIRSEAM